MSRLWRSPKTLYLYLPMAGRYCADVVFCLDASGSMRPCFDALRCHIGAFMEGLKSSGQITWDVRMDFLAHRATKEGAGSVHDFRTLRTTGEKLLESLYQTRGSTAFFTGDVAEFKAELSRLEAGGDEASFVALDTCMDFPWREAENCHRVIIMLTDERLEDGIDVTRQQEQIDAMIAKLHALRIRLFLVGPESPGFDALCAADRSEYLVVNAEQNGLATVPMDKVLEAIGKSVSVTVFSETPGGDAMLRGLFGQAKWGSTSATMHGD